MARATARQNPLDCIRVHVPTAQTPAYSSVPASELYLRCSPIPNCRYQLNTGPVRCQPICTVCGTCRAAGAQRRLPSIQALSITPRKAPSDVYGYPQFRWLCGPADPLPIGQSRTEVPSLHRAGYRRFPAPTPAVERERDAQPPTARRSGNARGGPFAWRLKISSRGIQPGAGRPRDDERSRIGGGPVARAAGALPLPLRSRMATAAGRAGRPAPSDRFAIPPTYDACPARSGRSR